MAGLRPSVLTSPRQKRRRKLARWSRVAGAVVAGIAVLLLLIGLYVGRHASSRLAAIEIAALGTAPEDVQLVTSPDVRNTLVVTTSGELDATDAVIIVQGGVRDEAAVLMIPADLKIRVPGTGEVRVDAVHAQGGPDLVVSAIRDYTGLRIDHYVEIDLDGLATVADALGGVAVCVDRPISDEAAGLVLDAGCHELNGTDAAVFMLSRAITEPPGVDAASGRLQRQRLFLAGALTEASRVRTYVDPFRARAVLDVLGRSVTTDTDPGILGMVRFANSIEDRAAAAVDQRIVPSYFSRETGFGHPYPEQAEAIFQALRSGGPLPDSGLTAPRELEPADVDIEVLNGAGVEGLASEVADLLAARGFIVQAVGNADDFDLVETIIAHGPGDEAKAQLVARFFDGRIVAVDRMNAGIDVVVTVGSDASQ